MSEHTHPAAADQPPQLSPWRVWDQCPFLEIREGLHRREFRDGNGIVYLLDDASTTGDLGGGFTLAQLIEDAPSRKSWGGRNRAAWAAADQPVRETEPAWKSATEHTCNGRHDGRCPLCYKLLAEGYDARGVEIDRLRERLAAASTPSAPQNAWCACRHSFGVHTGPHKDGLLRCDRCHALCATEDDQRAIGSAAPASSSPTEEDDDPECPKCGDPIRFHCSRSTKPHVDATEVSGNCQATHCDRSPITPTVDSDNTAEKNRDSKNQSFTPTVEGEEERARVHRLLDATLNAPWGTDYEQPLRKAIIEYRCRAHDIELARRSKETNRG